MIIKSTDLIQFDECRKIHICILFVREIYKEVEFDEVENLLLESFLSYPSSILLRLNVEVTGSDRNLYLDYGYIGHFNSNYSTTGDLPNFKSMRFYPKVFGVSKETISFIKRDFKLGLYKLICEELGIHYVPVK